MVFVNDLVEVDGCMVSVAGLISEIHRLNGVVDDLTSACEAAYVAFPHNLPPQLSAQLQDAIRKGNANANHS